MKWSAKNLKNCSWDFGKLYKGEKDMAVNYSPNFVGYKDVKPFRFWCQKVLPSVYDDSLSYYELLNKVVHYLNVVIDNLEGVEQNTDALLNAYNQLQDYVNTYFDNLDLGEEIERKINEMVEDGTFDEILAPAIAQYEQQLQQILNQYAAQADDYVEDAEAWAKGTRDGVAVSEVDPAYHKNSKWYAEKAEIDSNAAESSARLASDSADESEAWAKGTVNGSAVPSTADQYQDNSKYWCEQARQAAVDATNSEQAEAWATGEIGGVPVGSSDPQYQNSAKYWAEQAEQVVGDATYANEAQAWANGEINGTPVASTEPQYQNNAKYYAQQAQQAASDTTQSNEAEAWAVGTKNGVPVASTDEQYENNAKYYAQQAQTDAASAAAQAVESVRTIALESVAWIRINNVEVKASRTLYNGNTVQGSLNIPGLICVNIPVDETMSGEVDANNNVSFRRTCTVWDAHAVGMNMLRNNRYLIQGLYDGYSNFTGRYDNKFFTVWDYTTNNWAADGTTIDLNLLVVRTDYKSNGTAINTANVGD